MKRIKMHEGDALLRRHTIHFVGLIKPNTTLPISGNGFHFAARKEQLLLLFFNAFNARRKLPEAYKK